MASPFIAEIKMFAGTFAPRGYAFCNGQLLSISQNTALFSLVGTTYGGNGQTTFGLPDLRGRTPIHAGTGPGLSTYVLGQMSGVENVTLLATQMPAHTHAVSIGASTNPPLESSPAGAVVAGATEQSGPLYASAASANATMAAPTVATAGGSQPHSIVQPYLVVNFIIATQGIYPSRN
jgi:microcystin-dependent protein